MLDCKNFAPALLLSLISFFLGSSTTAQVTRTDGFVDANQGKPYSMIQEIPFVPSDYEGSFYIRDEWSEGDIFLYSQDSLLGYPLKFDLESQRMEIQVEAQVRVLDGNEIAGFSWDDETGKAPAQFINAAQFEFQGFPLKGMLEVLVDGEKMKLFSFKEITIKEGNYNRQIDIGDRTPKIVKVESFFLFHDGKVFKLNQNKRKTLLHFKGKSGAVADYAKENKLGYKKRRDLVELVAYYLTL